MKNCTGILCPMQHGTVDPATCQAVDYCPHVTPPRTKGDKIRAMTDEELADWLILNGDGSDYQTWLSWLREEAK